MFDFIMERPHIQSQMYCKYKELVEMFSCDLDRTKLVYDAQLAATELGRGIPPIAKNMPLIAGQLKWAQEMRARIEMPMKSFKALCHPYVTCCHLTQHVGHHIAPLQRSGFRGDLNLGPLDVQ